MTRAFGVGRICLPELTGPPSDQSSVFVGGERLGRLIDDEQLGNAGCRWMLQREWAVPQVIVVPDQGPRDLT